MNLLVVVFALGLHCNSCQLSCGFPQDPDSTELYEEVTVQHVSPTTPRLKTSDSPMPAELQFVLIRKPEQMIKLRLKRWEHTKRVFPVYRLQKGGRLQRIQLPNMTSSAGLYRGADSHDLYLVQVEVNGNFTNYTLHGSFWDAGKQYELKPPSVKYARTAHTVRKLEPLSYDGDIFYPPPDILYEKRKKTDEQRVRRQSVAKHYIELALVTDYPLFQRFLKFANNNTAFAESEMTQYYKYVAASIDRRYRTITNHFPNLKVRVYVNSLTICDDPSECLWSTNNQIPSTEKIDYTRALPEFRDFVVSSGSLKGDHQMFITGYQMAKSDGSTGNIGVAYVGTVCTDWSTSMIQDRFSGVTSGVASHELGHSLSALHDDHKTYTGCSNQHYVMNSFASFPASDSAATRPYFFSNCSANSIANYLTGAKASCTQNYPNSDDLSLSPAGQHFNADTQCMIYFGVGSKFCRNEQKLRGFDKMCTRVPCSQPNDPSTCSDIVPLDRTSCGDSQWCVDGICVRASEAPEKPKDCPQGDDPAMTCISDMCHNDTANLALCCQTCSDMMTHTHHATEAATIKVMTTTTIKTATTTPLKHCDFICQCRKKFSRFYCWLLSFG